MRLEVRHYVTRAGVDVFAKWLTGLPDRKAQARVQARIDRVERGLFGDCQPVGGGVWELRIDYGPGYRAYYARSGEQVILLLCGGDKRRQRADIEHAKEYWNDHQERTKPEGQRPR